MTIKNYVNELRAKNNLTQSDLARKVNVTRQTIVTLEKRSYVPSLLLAMKISQTFHLPIEQIFYMEDDKDG
ncbi:helix-turn-helix transcriptional regulator [Evansella sp. AB-P1]|uniref:helix-turn-helix transcriptional regulator n=1 Tax=Evansella sp. AB-P1 TaxID=3037653 RepID=UPI00241E0BAD|nr:helix-turn-helix transcriptional regulator [Evansella sp. AB-P1]MDG5790036.1 helix-turn-helix transcriptional regulator [Evansella sp. AB-P1]